MKVIEHNFPEIGSVRVQLHDESERLFDAFTSVDFLNPSILDDMDHLGDLRQVLHCGHHSRYEYLIFQLHLIEFFSKKHAYGFGCSTKISGREISSCSELLKCWTLISESGHLKGTYETERLWLYLICSDTRIQKLFYDLIGESEILRYSREVINNQDLYSFYKILSYIFLKNAVGQEPAQSNRENLELGILLYKALIKKSNVGSAIKRCQTYFNRIRKISHLFLDLARMPMQIRFHPSIIFDEMGKNPDLYIESDDTTFHEIADYLYKLLLDKVYASVPATKLKLEQMNSFIQQYQNGSNKINSLESLEKELIEARTSVSSYRPYNQGKFNHYLRLEFEPYFIFSMDECKVFKEEESLNSSFQSDHWRTFATTFKTEDGIGAIVDIFENSDTKEENEGLILKGLLEYIVKTYKDWNIPKEWVEYWLEDNLRNLFITCIKRFIREGIEIRIKTATSQANVDLQIVLKAERKSWSRKIANKLKKDGVEKDRVCESECLRREIRNSPDGKILVSNCELLFEDENHNTIAEFDGAFLRFYRGHVFLTLIEAKSGHSSGANQAKKELKIKLRKMGASIDEAEQLVSKAAKSAIAIIPLTMGRRWNIHCEAWDRGKWEAKIL